MKNTLRFLTVLSLALFLSFAFKSEDRKKTIIIDAGHGGKDFGVQIGADLEKQIVTAIANKIRLQNGKGEVEIILLREDDRFMALSERVAKINEINPDLLISLHINASKNASENGVNAYVSKNGFYDQSFAKANSLVDKIANGKLAKGAVKEGNFALTKNSKCPALLLEVGYLSNENDKNYITSESGQNEIAGKILDFVKE